MPIPATSKGKVIRLRWPRPAPGPLAGGARRIWSRRRPSRGAAASNASTRPATLAVLAQHPIHGADRAVVDALVEQTGVEFGWRLVGEAFGVQQIEHDLLLCRAQRPGRRWPRTRDRWRRAQPGTSAMHRGARNPERCTSRGGGDAAGRGERHDSVGHGSPSLDVSGLPSSSAIFFGVQ